MIGLIGSRDYLRANSNDLTCGSFKLNSENYATCAKTNWIGEIASLSAVTDQIGRIWTMTARTSTADYTVAIINNGNMGANSFVVSYNRIGVVPVLFLSSDIILLGKGTSANPYNIVS